MHTSIFLFGSAVRQLPSSDRKLRVTLSSHKCSLCDCRRITVNVDDETCSTRDDRAVPRYSAVAACWS